MSIGVKAKFILGFDGEEHRLLLRGLRLLGPSDISALVLMDY